MGVIDLLREGLEKKSEITVVYHGGSQAGTARTILPLKVTESEVRAKCLTTGKAKTFKISKMEIPPMGTPEYRELPVLNFETIEDFYDAWKTNLESMGWYVECNSEYLSLHGYFKNGKPKKGATIYLHIFPDREFRPYYLQAPGFSVARTYGNLNSALAALVEHSRENRKNI